jgi:hypothetical protein
VLFYRAALPLHDHANALLAGITKIILAGLRDQDVIVAGARDFQPPMSPARRRPPATAPLALRPRAAIEKFLDGFTAEPRAWSRRPSGRKQPDFPRRLELSTPPRRPDNREKCGRTGLTPLPGCAITEQVCAK